MSSDHPQGGGRYIRIRKNRTEIDIPADIQKSHRVIDTCRSEILAMTQALDQLERRREHFQELIDGENRYDKAALKRAIDALVVDKRQMEDVKTEQQKRIEHQLWIIGELEKRQLEEEATDGFVLQS